MLLSDTPKARQRFKGMTLSTAVIQFVMLAVTVQIVAQKAPGGHIITFDVPGAGARAGQGTVPRSIAANGVITGEYYDQNEVVHGFVRTADGSIKTFDVPGASKGNGQGTFSESVNPRGEITGFFYDASKALVQTRGFNRSANGLITKFDGGPNLGTIPLSINTTGATTGSYANQGFVRVNGVVRAFAVSKFVTVPKSINAKGEITGWFKDEHSVIHGFVRSAGGGISTFDAGPHVATTPVCINSAGKITGSYSGATAQMHGFVRSADGSIDTFDVEPDAFTIPYGINERGEITGAWYHATSLVHGFVLDPDGTITKFDAPGAAKRFAGYGTTPQSINARGEITGWYSDARGVYHGFVRIPAK